MFNLGSRQASMDLCCSKSITPTHLVFTIQTLQELRMLSSVTLYCHNFSRIVIWLRPWGATWSKLKLTHAIHWSTHPIRHNSGENRRPHNSTNALHHNIGKAFQETDLEEGLKINIGWSLQSTFAPVTSPAVTAGLTWQPDTCPMVWARVATWKLAFGGTFGQVMNLMEGDL